MRTREIVEAELSDFSDIMQNPHNYLWLATPKDYSARDALIVELAAIITSEKEAKNFTGTTTGTCPRCGKTPCKMPPNCNY